MRRFIGMMAAVALVALSFAGAIGTASAAPPIQGAISGYVYVQGGTTPIADATIYADYYPGGGVAGEPGTSDGNGYYTIVGLTTGQYVVHAIASAYQTEWYNNVTSEGDAQPVAVTVPNTTTGINFTMQPAGSISGHIYEANGTTPIGGAEVVADYYQTDEWANSAFSAADGSYTITGLVTGNYHVHAVKGGFATRWYDNIDNEDNAKSISVTAPADVPNVDIRLPAAGTISGHVYEQDGTTPIEGAYVVADFWDTDAYAGEAYSGMDGSYTIAGLITEDYYVYASSSGYATEYYNNKAGWSYLMLSDQVHVSAPNDKPGIDFTLDPNATQVITNDASNITVNSARLNGDLTWMGAAASVNLSFQWGTAAGGPYTELVVGARTTTGAFSADLSSLTPGTTYYYRARAVGDVTDLGSEKSFTTLPREPVVTTNTAGNVTDSSARLNGTLVSLGIATSVAVSFQWGRTSSYGSETAVQTLQNTGSVNATLNDLLSGTTYHFRIKADGDGEPVYGSDATFTTSSSTTPTDTTAPVVSAVETSGITASSSIITWTTNEAATTQIEYGLTTQYGSKTTLDTGLVTQHSVSLTGLETNKTYHYRVISTDASSNQVVSADYSFTTPESQGGMPPWAWAVIGIGAIAVLGAAAYLVTARNKKQRTQ